MISPSFLVACVHKQECCASINMVNVLYLSKEKMDIKDQVRSDLEEAFVGGIHQNFGR